MMRFIMPLILIGISTTVFLMFANPMYDQISELKLQVASYNEALDNSKALDIKKDELTTKKNAIKPADLEKLQKLLPQSIDNIRLILEIEKIALPYGMVLKDVRYSSTDKETKATTGTTATTATTAAAPQVPGVAVTTAPALKKDYGIWELGFSTSGSYNNFINFTKDLESNLRIVDVSSIQFSSSGNSATNSGGSTLQDGSYKYDFKIKTYWLKN